jgi:hypothetical protein
MHRAMPDDMVRVAQSGFDSCIDGETQVSQLGRFPGLSAAAPARKIQNDVVT